jgi:pyrroloquinoline quinone (PQQ) biosynthesis protein C
VEIIKKSHGPSCLHFLKLNGEEDIKHVKEAIALVESLGDDDRKLVNQNIEQTIYAYSGWLNDIVQQSSI